MTSFPNVITYQTFNSPLPSNTRAQQMNNIILCVLFFFAVSSENCVCAQCTQYIDCALFGMVCFHPIESV